MVENEIKDMRFYLKCTKHDSIKSFTGLSLTKTIIKMIQHLSWGYEIEAGISSPME